MEKIFPPGLFTIMVHLETHLENEAKLAGLVLYRKKKIRVTLCQMENIFPPGFFTIMVHLVTHLENEAKLAGPVHYRWMDVSNRKVSYTYNSFYIFCSFLHIDLY